MGKRHKTVKVSRSTLEEEMDVWGLLAEVVVRVAAETEGGPEEHQAGAAGVPPAAGAHDSGPAGALQGQGLRGAHEGLQGGLGPAGPHHQPR
jgi:hypothetical protein